MHVLVLKLDTPNSSYAPLNDYFLSVQDGQPMKMGEGGDTLATATRGHAHQDNEDEEDEDAPIYEKHDHLLHGKKSVHKFVSRLFMKKYIHVARAVKPVLTGEACDVISTEYTKLRAQETVSASKAKVGVVNREQCHCMCM